MLGEGRYAAVCIADLPPSPSSKTRYLVKRLHASLPDLQILVGRWSPAGMTDESPQALKDTGATMVAVTLIETREYLERLINMHGPAVDREAHRSQLVTA